MVVICARIHLSQGDEGPSVQRNQGPFRDTASALAGIIRGLIAVLVYAHTKRPT